MPKTQKILNFDVAPEVHYQRVCIIIIIIIIITEKLLMGRKESYQTIT